MNSKINPSLVRISIPTKDGDFRAGYSDKGLAELNFPSGKSAGKSVSKTPTPQKVAPMIRRWHRITTNAVKQILSGCDPKVMPPLDLSVGTDFQRSVWSAMRKIRCGQTKSYGEIARVVGNPNAVRAVGGACGANPIPVLVPCHRVVAANRKIGGFSGGLDWKRKLLLREGVQFSN